MWGDEGQWQGEERWNASDWQGNAHLGGQNQELEPGDKFGIVEGKEISEPDAADGMEFCSWLAGTMKDW